MNSTPTSTAETDRPLRIAVVGGGISGLAAAHRLRQLAPKVQLSLFEASGRLGGPLHTAQVGNLLVERGADSFITKLPWGVNLCRQLGIETELMPTNPRHRRALVLRDRQLHPIPAGFVLMRPQQMHSLLRSPLLSWPGRLRICLEPLVPATLETHGSAADETVAAFATRRLGREAYERLVEPLFAGIYVADGQKLSVAATMPEFLRDERESGSLYLAARAARWSSSAAQRSPQDAAGARYSAFVAPRNGLSTIVEALTAALPAGAIQLHAEATAIERRDLAWRLALRTAQGDLQRDFDGIVLATPAPRAGSLLEQVDSGLSDLLHGIQVAGSVVVTLIYGAGQIGRPLDAFGFVTPAVERRPIVAASFPSVKFPDRDHDGLTPIRVFLGGALRPELIQLSDQELIDVAADEIRPLLSISGVPVATDVARWPASMPQYHVGHLQRIDAIDRRVQRLQRLELAGNGYRGVGIPQCIRSGREAAERLASTLLSSGATT